MIMTGSVTQPGSPGTFVQGGLPQGDAQNFVPKDMYSSLESKLGEQGRELGEYKKFFDTIQPLLDKLDENPELAKAIVDGKIDPSLTAAISEGRVTVKEAEQITAAHNAVKNQSGEEYKNMSPDQIAEAVEKRVMSTVSSKMEQADGLRRFEEQTADFIKNTPDFETLSGDIKDWLDEHEDIDDVRVAYYAVKGALSEKQARNQTDLSIAEEAKRMALNATGGGSNATYIPSGDSDPIDQFVSGSVSPNRF